MVTPSPIDFTLPDADGAPFRLGEHRGQPVLVYFYPRDNTPGCTGEANDFRALHDQFTGLGCLVVGVSRDSSASHRRFADKQGLPFPLLADVDETVCQQFGVIKMKKMYGKTVRGIERSTFLIDRQGCVAREWRGVKVAGHAAEVLAAVRSLPQ